MLATVIKKLRFLFLQRRPFFLGNIFSVFFKSNLDSKNLGESSENTLERGRVILKRESEGSSYRELSLIWNDGKKEEETYFRIVKAKENKSSKGEIYEYFTLPQNRKFALKADKSKISGRVTNYDVIDFEQCSFMKAQRQPDSSIKLLKSSSLEEVATINMSSKKDNSWVINISSNTIDLNFLVILSVLILNV